RRMGPGRNKMLLKLEGEALVRRAARRALAAGLSPVVVVLGHESDRAMSELAGLACEVVVNPDFTGPTSGSLHKGLEQLGPDVGAAVVLLADMVLVTQQMLAGLVAAARGSPRSAPGSRASHAASDLGQSSCNRRESARSASTRPPVWHVAQ